MQQAQAQTQPTPAPAQAQHQPLQKQQKQHHQQQYVQPGAVQYMVCFVPADPTGASGLGGYGMGGYGMGGMHQMTMGMPMVQMGANAGWGAPAGQQQVYWGQQSQPSQPSQPAEQGGKDEAKSWADPSARPFTPSGMQDASALSFTGQAASWREGPRGKDGGRRQEQQQSWRRPEADESWRKGGGKGGGGKGPGKAELLGYPADKKVWVGDLPAGCTADDLMAHFGLAGSVQHVALMRTGTAGVVFSDAAEAEAAVVHLNGTEINDQAVKVEAWQQAA